MIIGVTGSRYGPTQVQRIWLFGMLAEAQAVHHGACVGVDAAAHSLALTYELPVTVHPPQDLTHADTSTMVPLPGITVRERRSYLTRNQNIVDECEVLLALPMGPEERRSGTWATVRYARKIGRRGWICQPDGQLAPI